MTNHRRQTEPQGIYGRGDRRRVGNGGRGRFRGVWSSGLAFAALCAGLAACSSADATGTAALLTSNPYAALRLNVQAAVMSMTAPYDTLQLSATPYDADGHVLVNGGLVTYQVSDTCVQVSATGLVTAKGVTTNSFVIAKLQDTQLNVTHVDTAYITITNQTAPPTALAKFSIQLPSGDSAKVDIAGFFNTTKTLPVTAIDALGDSIPSSSLLVHFTSADAGRAIIDGKRGIVKAVEAGVVTIRASTTYYGVTRTDSVKLLMGYADAEMASFQFYGDSLFNGGAGELQGNIPAIGVGGTIIFQAGLTYVYDKGDSINVFFDDSTVPQASPLASSVTNAMNGTGNIGPYGLPLEALNKLPNYAGQTFLGYYATLVPSVCNAAPYPCAVMRSFPKAGVYEFHFGSQSGFIYVLQNPTFNP